MKLTIIIVDDKKNHMDLLENNITKVFDEYHYEGNLLNEIESIEVIPLHGTGIDDGIHKYYIESDLIDDLNDMVTTIRDNNNSKIGVCLDLKLCKSDEEYNFIEQPRKLKLVKNVINRLRQLDVVVCPITAIPNFDEFSSSLIGEDVGDNYFNKESTVIGCVDSEVLKLIYYLMYNEMPKQSEIDDLFDYD